MTITAAQCRAARALVDVSREMLSESTGIDAQTIRSFEKKLEAPGAEDAHKLQQGLEALGAVFLAEDQHGGAGVRLRFTRSESKRISALENEGGPVGEDDVIG